MDVIEIPSHFMENFMKDPRTVQQFARHHCSGDVLPAGLIEQAVQDDKQFGALDMEVQVKLPCVMCQVTVPGYCARLLCQVTVPTYCARLLCQVIVPC